MPILVYCKTNSSGRWETRDAVVFSGIPESGPDKSTIFFPKMQPSSVTRKNFNLFIIRMKLNGIIKFKYVSDTLSRITKESTEVVFLTTRLLNLYVLNLMMRGSAVKITQAFIYRSMSVCTKKKIQEPI